MRLGRIRENTQVQQIVDLNDGKGWRAATAHLADILQGRDPQAGDPIGSVEDLLAPIAPGNVIGIGVNFVDTVQDLGWSIPQRPFLFPKFASSVIGPEHPILIDPTLTRRVDWEGELAIVIGRRAHRVDKADARHHIFGYTVANDISARDLQEIDGQWVRGKAMDTFCPLGPWIVTADDIDDAQNLRINTRVDGDLVQDGTTADMIFPIDELVAYVSSFITLQPGDVLLSGTPAGCGEWMDPPRHLDPGNTVEVEIDGIGTLRSPVARDEVSRHFILDN